MIHLSISSIGRYSLDSSVADKKTKKKLDGSGRVDSIYPTYIQYVKDNNIFNSL